ncbi:MoaD/ThiS family protein [Cellulosimicrobium composti]|uniref:Molybdopterin synthase sulfur carrier subunit n=1 Tax=Cellulosimicrobium composti TaxID=2672572 RepID=A0A6N7ZM25_9MICO|nr:MoaD/ThiS family protein [Cellulosimicrobium composti]MTG90565.1 MoaD/ThiS family protein [Cellulosimicrobium composti]TWG81927.1 molybdopterin converting factor small subunit [Cellulosimicrobium cellulans J34]SMF38348.1 Molybdopterin converting factor, small subunit [Cellulosimicrobium cellulans J1]
MATVRYFAGARDAAGTETETVDAATVGELHAALVARHAGLADVLPRCSLLVGGVRASSDDAPVGADETVDVLPPFAGG